MRDRAQVRDRVQVRDGAGAGRGAAVAGALLGAGGGLLSEVEHLDFNPGETRGCFAGRDVP